MNSLPGEVECRPCCSTSYGNPDVALSQFFVNVYIVPRLAVPPPSVVP
jgi:hypothetical protein